MGFFKDLKGDYSNNSNVYNNIAAKDYEEDTVDNMADDEDMMVNTLDDADYSSIDNGFAGDVISDANDNYGIDDIDEDMPADETAVITQGLSIVGDLESIGSIDVFGTVVGNVTCKGKMTVSGSITGNCKAGEIFANNAQFDGNIEAKGSVKIGQGTVIVGNVTATSAVIAGAVKGDIDIRGPVVVDSTAIIVGDIKSKTVQINNGATIDGRCSQCYSDVNTESIFDIKKK